MLPRHLWCQSLPPEAREGLIEHLSPTQAAQQRVTKIISLVTVNLVTPKVGANHELVQQTGLCTKNFLRL